MFGLDKINNTLYHCGCGECGSNDYGYRAFVNGNVMGIASMRTVDGLKGIMPDVTIHHDDRERWETAVLGNTPQKIEIIKTE